MYKQGFALTAAFTWLLDCDLSNIRQVGRSSSKKKENNLALPQVDSRKWTNKENLQPNTSVATAQHRKGSSRGNYNRRAE
jgi:hypothetical protein